MDTGRSHWTKIAGNTQRSQYQAPTSRYPPHAFAYQDDTLEEQKRDLREVFRRLKEASLYPKPNFSRTFILQTDAGDYGIGAMLTQDTEKGKNNLLFEPNA